MAALEHDEHARVLELAREVAREQVASTMRDGGAQPQPAQRRALLIINAKSGRNADSLLKVRAIATILASYGIHVDARVKLKKSIARRDARRAAKNEGYPLVIAAGGDGTVAAVARGLAGTNATLGIVPLGTYNNTAHSLGIPTNLLEACALIAAGPVRSVDLGEVRATGKRKPGVFVEMAAVGLAAALTPIGQHLEKGRWDEAREALPGTLEMKPTIATVELDGERPPLRTHTLLVLLANGPRSGAGLDLVPSARMDDGLLDVHVFEDADQAALLARFVATLGDAPTLAGTATRAHARRVRLETPLPMPVVADSKVVGTTPATFRVRAAALRVIVGNGPGLTRPVADTTLQAVQATARANALATGSDGHDPAPPVRQLATRVLAEVVPTAAELAEQARTARRDALPIAGAVLAGALLVPVLRRLAGR